MDTIRNFIGRAVWLFTRHRRAIPFRDRLYYHPTEHRRDGRVTHASWREYLNVEDD